MSPQEIHKDRGPTLLGVSWALTILATIFVGMRCYCRIAYSMKIWWDDVWMGITIVSCFNSSILTYFIYDTPFLALNNHL